MSQFPEPNECVFHCASEEAECLTWETVIARDHRDGAESENAYSYNLVTKSCDATGNNFPPDLEIVQLNGTSWNGSTQVVRAQCGGAGNWMIEKPG